MMKYGAFENKLLYCVKKLRLRSARLQYEHVLMIAMKMKKQLISRLWPCFLKAKVLANKDVYLQQK